MGNEPPIHPLRTWRERNKRTVEDVSALIKVRGFEFKARSLVSVEDGWRHPSYEICKVIQSITDQEVTIDELREWPLRGGESERDA